MKKKAINLENGFTLIELMIVVVIIGVIAAVALPTYNDAIQKSRRSDAYDALLDCAAAQTRRYTTSSPSSYLDQAGIYGRELCGATNVANQLFSKDGHYFLTITNNNCEVTGGRFWCFSITATAQGSQTNDSDCLTLTIDQTGRKTATPNVQGSCWRS